MLKLLRRAMITTETFIPRNHLLSASKCGDSLFHELQGVQIRIANKRRVLASDPQWLDVDHFR